MKRCWDGWSSLARCRSAIVGLLFKKQIEGTFTKNLWVIATMMIVDRVVAGDRRAGWEKDARR